jgi:hypothetical protein
MSISDSCSNNESIHHRCSMCEVGGLNLHQNSHVGSKSHRNFRSDVASRINHTSTEICRLNRKLRSHLLSCWRAAHGTYKHLSAKKKGVVSQTTDHIHISTAHSHIIETKRIYSAILYNQHGIYTRLSIHVDW